MERETVWEGKLSGGNMSEGEMFWGKCPTLSLAFPTGDGSHLYRLQYEDFNSSSNSSITDRVVRRLRRVVETTFGWMIESCPARSSLHPPCDIHGRPPPAGVIRSSTAPADNVYTNSSFHIQTRPHHLCLSL